MAGGRVRISFAGWGVSNKFVKVVDGPITGDAVLLDNGVIYETDETGKLLAAFDDGDGGRGCSARVTLQFRHYNQ